MVMAGSARGYWSTPASCYITGMNLKQLISVICRGGVFSRRHISGADFDTGVAQTASAAAHCKGVSPHIGPAGAVGLFHYEDQPLMTVTQTTRLIAWVIVGLIVLGILLFLFGPAALRTDEMIIIGVLIIGLIWFQVWLRRRS